MTRLQLRELVITHTQREDKEDLINSAIDLAIQEIGRRHGFGDQRITAQQPISTDDSSVTVPDGCFEILKLRCFDSADDESNANIIDLLSKNQVYDLYPDQRNGSSGKPCVAYREGDTLFFIPPTSQDRVIEFTYHNLVTMLENDTDQNPYAGTDDAVVCWATAYVYRSIQLDQDFMIWMQSYERAYQIVKKSDLRRDGQRRQMQGAMYSNNADPQNVDYDPYVNKYTRV